MLSTLEDIKLEMESALDSKGQYVHNELSLLLRIADNLFGRETANSLVDEYNLTTLYGIHKEVK